MPVSKQQQPDEYHWIGRFVYIAHPLSLPPLVSLIRASYNFVRSRFVHLPFFSHTFNAYGRKWYWLSVEHFTANTHIKRTHYHFDCSQLKNFGNCVDGMELVLRASSGVASECVYINDSGGCFDIVAYINYMSITHGPIGRKTALSTCHRFGLRFKFGHKQKVRLCAR